MRFRRRYVLWEDRIGRAVKVFSVGQVKVGGGGETLRLVGMLLSLLQSIVELRGIESDA